jgi:hypothetical protein
MKLTRTLVIFIVALFLIIFLLLTNRSPKNGFVLQDGTTIELLEVSYAPTNSFVCTSGWRRFLRDILPTTLKSSVTVDTMNAPVWRTNSPAFFIRLQNSKGIHQRISAAALLDEFGLEYQGNGYSSGFRTSSPKEHFVTFYIGLQGPHHKIAGLRLYADDRRRKRIGDLKIPGVQMKNQKIVRSFEPIEKSDGAVQVRLTSLATGWRSSPDPGRPNLTNDFSQVTFLVLTNQHPSMDWDYRLWIAGSDGKYSEIPTLTGNSGEETVLQFRKALKPEELYHFKLGLIRREGFTAEERCDFKNLPFPSENEVIKTNLSVPIQGVTLVLERIGGVGTAKDNPFASYLQMQITPPQKNINVWVEEATGERGQKLWTAGYDDSGNEGTSFQWFQASNVAQRMNVTFVVHKTHFFEFEARPARINPDIGH